MEEKIIHLSNFLDNKSYIAHPPDETLLEHSNLTLEYLKKIFKTKNLETIIKNLIEKIDKEHQEKIYEMFINAIYLHDIGKKNPYFQAKKMDNREFADFKNSSSSTDHSPLSADEYIKYYVGKYKEYPKKIRYKLFYIMYNFAYAMQKHHGSLVEFEKFRDSNTFLNVIKHKDRYDIAYFEFYILNKLLFSLLVSSDYYATSEYMSRIKITQFGLFGSNDKETAYQVFSDFIGKFDTKGINRLRRDIFDATQKELEVNLHKHIYYLEAPTGSGKTITSINLALKLLQSDNRINKLFYIFPFNTLVEQTRNVFDAVFGDRLGIEVVNSVSPIEDKEGEYTKSYINRLFFHSPIVLTTHVRLFDILFGTSREDNFPLWQLANSVIIIDEIQSYNNNLWWYMVEFFDKYASLLNIKIIIMSATLPKLDFFLEQKDNFVELLKKEKRDEVFSSSFFKDRVKIDFTLLDRGKIELLELVEFFEKNRKDYKKVLFEFIKKQSAREFYLQIKERFDNVYELSGDDNKAYREYVIAKSKEDKPIIIVATQVIEAGVDIDMDLGFKDISTIDSEEQFMGRINRSCNKSDAKVYFFDMDNERDIYKGDHRLHFSLREKKYREILENKEFSDYYHEVLEVIKKDTLRFKSGLNSQIDTFYSSLKVLDYKGINKTMTLINQQNFTLYFPFLLDISKFKMIKEFKELDGELLTDGKLDGLKVWQKYLALQEIDEYAKMKVKYSFINNLMQYFTFNILKFNDKSRPCKGEEIAGYFYVEDLSYIDEDGKFDRAKFQDDCGSLFL